MRKFFSLFVAALAVCSMSAKTLYLAPNANWKSDNARFAVYAFNDDKNIKDWHSMTAVQGKDGIFTATVSDEAVNVLFARMNPSIAENNFDKGDGKPLWNKTKDLGILADQDLFTINEGDWDNADGQWSKFDGGSVTPPAEGDSYFMKNKWNGGEWAWKLMTKDGENYKLDNVVFGGEGVNYNTTESDEGSKWVESKDFKGDKIGALDTVNLVLDPQAGTVTAKLLGKHAQTGEVKYFMKNKWNGGEWAWKEMTKDGENYKLENVVFGGEGVNYNTTESDVDATWVAVNSFLGDRVGELDTINLVLDPKAGKVTAKVLGRHGEAPAEPSEFYLVGSFSEWKRSDTYKFAANAEVDGEYKLETTLNANDELKVVGLAGEKEFWYPDGENYKVNEELAGKVQVFFRPQGNAEWAAFGGYFFIEKIEERAIEEVQTTVRSTKVIRNGQLFIEKNGVLYNAQGTIVQ